MRRQNDECLVLVEEDCQIANLDPFERQRGEGEADRPPRLTERISGWAVTLSSNPDQTPVAATAAQKTGNS